jgi:hypothetical protein
MEWTMEEIAELLAQKIEQNGEIMRQGFAETHKRFEQLDGWFSRMFTFMTIGFSFLAVTVTLFKFLV